ncbi:hypothetical protein M422DRAFT_276637 [Sphaerobolus stellatus SS14]|uniref:Uncharacterized protein n=1 Tax=Sphaerobolus stellatus (strain SS14) TaxID=990650 RepID=A0A0C9UBL5_SPHS4|nr:hypothetical protein M422DRAFT_276637 [Sphaerobolus stellatus SS14]
MSGKRKTTTNTDKQEAPVATGVATRRSTRNQVQPVPDDSLDQAPDIAVQQDEDTDMEAQPPKKRIRGRRTMSGDKDEAIKVQVALEGDIAPRGSNKILHDLGTTVDPPPKPRNMDADAISTAKDMTSPIRRATDNLNAAATSSPLPSSPTKNMKEHEERTVTFTIGDIGTSKTRTVSARLMVYERRVLGGQKAFVIGVKDAIEALIKSDPTLQARKGEITRTTSTGVIVHGIADRLLNEPFYAPMTAVILLDKKVHPTTGYLWVDLTWASRATHTINHLVFSSPNATQHNPSSASVVMSDNDYDTTFYGFGHGSTVEPQISDSESAINNSPPPATTSTFLTKLEWVCQTFGVEKVPKETVNAAHLIRRAQAVRKLRDCCMKAGWLNGSSKVIWQFVINDEGSPFFNETITREDFGELARIKESTLNTDRYGTLKSYYGMMGLNAFERELERLGDKAMEDTDESDDEDEGDEAGDDEDEEGDEEEEINEPVGDDEGEEDEEDIQRDEVRRRKEKRKMAEVQVLKRVKGGVEVAAKKDKRKRDSEMKKSQKGVRFEGILKKKKEKGQSNEKKKLKQLKATQKG